MLKKVFFEGIHIQKLKICDFFVIFCVFCDFFVRIQYTKNVDFWCFLTNLIENENENKYFEKMKIKYFEKMKINIF